MTTNLFPAVLLAGPPNCGKSVLAFLLTRHLRESGIAHYLLRAAPDGEGDWFLTGQPEIVQTLRSIHKRKFSSEFIAHMHSAIEARPLPLLVDIGGKPQGEQLNLIRACTHSILLYRTNEERSAWRDMLNNAKLLPIAELRSIQLEEEKLEERTEREPWLRGQINGLERDITKRKTGMVFGSLLERVAGICSYDAVSLEQEHLKHAPFPIVNERELAKRLSVPVDGERMTWSPSHLKLIPKFVTASTPLAIYGRGPVWLASALAAHALPETFAIFDARYGWLLPPPIHFGEPEANVKVRSQPYQIHAAWIDLELPGGTLEPYEISLDLVHSGGGIVLSGKIPRWLFATLTHRLAPDHDWIAVDDPRLERAIVVHSRLFDVQPGDVLARVEKG